MTGKGMGANARQQDWRSNSSRRYYVNLANDSTSVIYTMEITYLQDPVVEC